MSPNRIVLAAFAGLACFTVMVSPAAVAQEGDNQVSFQATLHKLDLKGSRGQPHKLFIVRMLKGQTYVIDMVSSQFDTYLRLETSSQNAIGEDDDGGGGLNSRLRFTPPNDDDYRIQCTTYNGSVGDFVLKITQDAGSKDGVTPIPKKIVPKKIVPKKVLPKAAK